FNQGDRPLPGYTIQRGVGRGGFGEVYYATSDGGKEVALKYLRENPQVELRGVTHCLNLKSPYLVSIHDIRQNAEGDSFVIMEYVSGPSLRDLLNATSGEPDSPLSGLGAQKAAYFLREIGKGLSYLHDRGIVHRDMKPGNIFYEDGYVKIGDYGLAKIMAASQHSGQTVSVGTVHYMAPEVGSGNYDRTIDIYALGVILYEMLLGRVPYSGATMGEVLMKHLTAQPVVDELPEPFPRVIRKALAKDPKDRYQTVNEMVSELFEVEDLNRSVAAFEPLSLSTLAGRAVKEAHVGIGAAVRPLGTGSSNVGQGVPPPVIDPGAVAGRLGHAEGRIAGRVDPVLAEPHAGEPARPPLKVAENVLLAVMACAGMSTAVAILTGEALPFALTLFTACLTVIGGVLGGYWIAARRLTRHGQCVPKLIAAALVAAVIGPASAIIRHGDLLLSIEDFQGLILLAVLCLNWRRRLSEGRRRHISLRLAFTAGLFGFVAATVLGDGQWLPLAVLLATASLGFQAVAGSLRWPRSTPETETRTADDNRRVADVVARNAGVAVTPWSDTTRGAETLAAPDRAESHPEVRPAVATRVPRTEGVRAAWMLLSALLLAASSLTFIAAGVIELDEGIFGECIIGGIALFQAFLFALSCAVPRYRNGLWRGVFRKAVFFGGIGVSAGCAASIGLFNLEDEALFLALIGVIGGGLTMLFVWFVPMPAYVPPVDTPLDEQENGRRWWSAKRYLIAGGALLGAGALLLPILMVSTHESDWQDVLPGGLIPVGAVGVAFIMAGLAKARAVRTGRLGAKRITLPLRRVFDVDGGTNLSGLIERHLTALGYQLVSKSDLLWSFVRGNWAAHVWQSNIQEWRAKLNIAAYELADGGLRLTVYLNLDAPFKGASRKQIAALDGELSELVELLGGREVPSDPQRAVA
ncbi:MAG: serine/threonine-protein kinase, partial [Phycisphaerae bacterium]